MIRIEELHKSFGDREVLRGINATVDRNGVLAVLGPVGIEEIDAAAVCRGSGAVPGRAGRGRRRLIGYRDGDRRTRLGDRDLSRQRADIGMVFQSYNLFPHLTALQNVMLGLVHVKHLPESEATAIANDWLDRVGLRDRGGSHPAQLSGGQQQRVAIARAAATQPRCCCWMRSRRPRSRAGRGGADGHPRSGREWRHDDDRHP